MTHPLVPVPRRCRHLGDVETTTAQLLKLSPQGPLYGARRAKGCPEISTCSKVCPAQSSRSWSARRFCCNYCSVPGPARTLLSAPPRPGTCDTVQVPTALGNTLDCGQQGSPGKGFLLKTGNGVLFIKEVEGNARARVCGHVNGRLGSLPRH